ncbi:DUF5808 domain-containing protein [Fictibacillus sp. Mic-4]|uniref:DUF1648 domain-containing protein n=1 Tax=Fictibacillus sp. Mic-4 TaxID=3132826 RepID=UPI003CF12F19
MEALGWMIFFITFLPIAVLIIFIPYLTRKTESFGVSIPEEVYQLRELAGLRKKYAYVTGLFALVISIVLLLIGARKQELLFPGMITLFLIGSFLIYYVFHLHMKKMKAEKKWDQSRPQKLVIDSKFRSQKLAVSSAWFLVPFMISLATLFMSMTFYKQIPEKMPLKYDFSGHVTSWGHKSYRTVLMLPAIQFYLTILFTYLNSTIVKAKQQINPADPETSIKQNLIFRWRWSFFNFVTGTVIVLLFFLIQLSFIVTINPIVLIIVPIVAVCGILLAAIILSFTTGQGGSRVKISKGQENRSINREDDRHWKLGIFYFNPDDPAVWMEKRFGIGWTLNFARPLSWLILFMILVPAIIIPLFLSS